MWLVEGGVALPNGYFKRNIMLDEDDIKNFRDQYGNRDIYITTWKYDSMPQAQAKIIGDLYFDLDSNDINHALYDAQLLCTFLSDRFGLPIGDIKLYFSGSKGIHVIVPHQLFNLQPHENLNMVYRIIAEEAMNDVEHKTIDLAIYDKRRLFRLPNSINGKTGLYKIPVSFDEVTSLCANDIKDMAHTPRATTYTVPTINYRAMEL